MCRFNSQDVRSRVQPRISSSAKFRTNTHAAYKDVARSLVGGYAVSLELEFAKYRRTVLHSFPDPKSRRAMLWEPQISQVTYSFCSGKKKKKCIPRKHQRQRQIFFSHYPEGHNMNPPPSPLTTPQILTTVSFRSCSWKYIMLCYVRI
jgi:hypothetical protein